ncbi:histidinol-phosphate transaminase [Paramaledivibacter caminithermalis]|jgi:histidinol-phosphate aminotransferase|uniref:Histidinol-phosphate aminotransferase n=1 Tax=Paramaledivibacter caminithermalis (strain DSM 15212 / CIP 107654 / DViRD3) TaxID=1121301 RepID=A0A1M6K9H7_PARC5|nr:histidinol-phosphate transaminase [Paramaledivibacter caminithermalis]SHJ55564.1 histidinol-phosphate aminotransferase [Paramaledivibacter caminithermalis DSM 15212]
MKDLIKKSIKDLKPYKVIEEEYRIKLDANESPYNIFQYIGELILKELTALTPNRYPDNEAIDIKKALSMYIGVNEENILCGNGSDEILKIIIDTFVDKGDTVVSHSPSFAMYRIITQIAGGSFLEVEGDKDFSIDINKIINKANENNAKVIFLCSPNNPTGRIISREDIIRVLDNTKSLIVVDEAYYEFYGETIVDKIDDYERLIVLRTLSKAFGLAGLRIGYGVASKNMIETISKVKAPYNLNSISKCIGRIVLDNKEIAFKNIEAIKNERDRLYKELKKIEGIQAIPSKSNFILIRTNKYKALMTRFKEEKILVKGFGTEGVLENCIRLTVGTDDENMEVLKILKEV